ncbi:hypothetical protein AGMMS49546_39240 [Spirochaetia bacterium]|nr:hypothetical protein AGMMS49546_39240 [Spirochaetia bacterium]
MEQIEAKGESKDVLRKINEVFGSVLTYAMDNGADYRAMLHKTADEYGRITDETEGVGAMIEDALKDTVTQPREKKKDWVYIVQQKNPVWN